MQDNLDPREYRNPSAPKGDQPARPITDREVPLTGQQTPAAIHSWLDGELSESAVRQSDASRDVDFWLRLDREVQVRRQMTTPAHLYERIMEALPDCRPGRYRAVVHPLLQLDARGRYRCRRRCDCDRRCRWRDGPAHSVICVTVAPLPASHFEAGSFFDAFLSGFRPAGPCLAKHHIEFFVHVLRRGVDLIDEPYSRRKESCF